MSEVIDRAERRFVGRAYVTAYPGAEFSHALEGFMNPEHVLALGGSALKLVSETSIGVVSGPEDGDDSYRRTVISRSELSRMSRDLMERQRSVRPRVSPFVSVKGYAPDERSPDEREGIDLRFQLIMDELTERVLRSTTILDAEDGGMYVHYRLRHPHMNRGPALLEARDNLLDLLRHPRPRMIESIHLSSTDLHR